VSGLCHRFGSKFGISAARQMFPPREPKTSPGFFAYCLVDFRSHWHHLGGPKAHCPYGPKPNDPRSLILFFAARDHIWASSVAGMLSLFLQATTRIGVLNPPDLLRSLEIFPFSPFLGLFSIANWIYLARSVKTSPATLFTHLVPSLKFECDFLYAASPLNLDRRSIT